MEMLIFLYLVECIVAWVEREFVGTNFRTLTIFFLCGKRLENLKCVGGLISL